MKEKISNLIQELEFAGQKLKNSNCLSKIIVKDDKVTFAIDVGILGINSQESEILVGKIKEEIGKICDFKVNAILTKNQSETKVVAKKIADHSVVKGVKKIIIVASGKGGVGKSTVAVNLAISLKRIGHKIGLVDADIYGPSVEYLMNLKGKPENEEKLMIPINSYGVDCISVGSLIDAGKAAIWRGPMISKVLNQLINGVKWQDIDYLIIDLPPGTGDIHLSLIQQFKPDGAVLVSTPQNLALIDVVKAADMFETLKVPIIGVIENMSYLINENGDKNYIFGKGLIKKMAEDLKVNFLGDIFLDAKINQANDDRNPICNSSPSDKISFEFGKIAENILDFI